jgi:hypothetical protein
MQPSVASHDTTTNNCSNSAHNSPKDAQASQLPNDTLGIDLGAKPIA